MHTWAGAHRLLADVVAKEQLPEAEERHECNVRVKWSNSELGCEESRSCHSARPATNVFGASRDEQCASGWKKLGGDRADDSKNRTCARSTRLYDALTRLTALGRHARELFNRRCKRVSKYQRYSQPCELTTCVHAPQTYTHEP